MNEQIIVDADRAASDRNAPGSAFMTEAPKACGTGALLLALTLWFATPYVTFDVLGTIVVIAEVVFLLGLIAVGAWTKHESMRPDATLADLMPQRVIAACIFIMAGLGWFLLIPL